MRVFENNPNPVLRGAQSSSECHQDALHANFQGRLQEIAALDVSTSVESGKNFQVQTMYLETLPESKKEAVCGFRCVCRVARFATLPPKHCQLPKPRGQLHGYY